MIASIYHCPFADKSTADNCDGGPRAADTRGHRRTSADKGLALFFSTFFVLHFQIDLLSTLIWILVALVSPVPSPDNGRGGCRLGTTKVIIFRPSSLGPAWVRYIYIYAPLHHMNPHTYICICWDLAESNTGELEAKRRRTFFFAPQKTTVHVLHRHLNCQP